MTGLLIRNRQLVANLSLPPYNSQACLPSWFPFWASPGYSCRPVSHVSLPLISFLSCSCLQPPCNPSLSPFSLGCSTAATLFPERFFLLPFGLLLVAATAVSPRSWQSFPFMILYLWFLCLYTFGRISHLVSHALLAYRTYFLPLYLCYWFISKSIDPFLFAIFCNLCGMMLSGVYAGVISALTNPREAMRTTSAHSSRPGHKEDVIGWMSMWWWWVMRIWGSEVFKFWIAHNTFMPQLCHISAHFLLVLITKL